MLRSGVVPGSAMTPSVDITTCSSESSSVAPASSQNHAPSGNRGSAWAATCNDSRVLPTPPTPVSVTSRAVCSDASMAASSASRPTNDVVGNGRLPANASRERSRGNSRGSPLATTW